MASEETLQRFDSDMELIAHLEQENSKQNWQVVVDYVGSDPSKFDTVVEVFINGPQKIVQRIGQPFGTILEKYPHLIFPYIPQLIACLRTHPIDAVKRNIMRSFQWIQIPEDHVGEIFDMGMLYIKTQTEPKAIKVFSLTVLRQLCERYPELTNEVIFQLEIVMKGDASAGVLSRGEKEMRKLKALRSKC